MAALVPRAEIVATNTGTKEQYNATANAEGGWSIPSVANGTYTISVTVPNFKTTVMKDVKVVLAAYPPPSGMRLELGGQYASQQDAFRGLLLVLALAAASVVAVMVLQFQSFVEALIVLLAAPLSFIGAVGLLLITGTPLNVSSFMGLILLVGLIVKNGIILLDFTRHRMQAGGLPLEKAIIEAARVRLPSCHCRLRRDRRTASRPGCQTSDAPGRQRSQAVRRQ